MNPQVPSFEQLLDWVEGRLTEPESAQIADQVTHPDDDTRAMLAWLRNFHDVSVRLTLVDPPAHVHQELRQRFRSQMRDTRKPGLFRRLAALLTFDSGAQFATAGVRAVNGLGNQRQIVFSAENADVVINTQPSKGASRLDVLGQVLFTKGDEEAASGENNRDNMPLVVQLLRGDTEVGLTQIDEIGEFAFDAIVPGLYEFVISSDRFEIQTASVELKFA